MFRRGVVQKITEKKILVTLANPNYPLESFNFENDYKYKAKNKKNFHLEKGMTVTLQFSDLANGLKGIIAFLFPIVSAFAGFYLSPKIAPLLRFTASENFKAILSGALFLFSCAAVCFLSRSGLWLEHPQIVGIYKKEEK